MAGNCNAFWNIPFRRSCMASNKTNIYAIRRWANFKCSSRSYLYCYYFIILMQWWLPIGYRKKVFRELLRDVLQVFQRRKCFQYSETPAHFDRKVLFDYVLRNYFFMVNRTDWETSLRHLPQLSYYQPCVIFFFRRIFYVPN